MNRSPPPSLVLKQRRTNPRIAVTASSAGPTATAHAHFRAHSDAEEEGQTSASSATVSTPALSGGGDSQVADTGDLGDVDELALRSSRFDSDDELVNSPTFLAKGFHGLFQSKSFSRKKFGRSASSSESVRPPLPMLIESTRESTSMERVSIDSQRGRPRLTESVSHGFRSAAAARLLQFRQPPTNMQRRRSVSAEPVLPSPSRESYGASSLMPSAIPAQSSAKIAAGSNVRIVRRLEDAFEPNAQPMNFGRAAQQSRRLKAEEHRNVIAVSPLFRRNSDLSPRFAGPQHHRSTSEPMFPPPSPQIAPAPDKLSFLQQPGFPHEMAASDWKPPRPRRPSETAAKASSNAAIAPAAVPPMPVAPLRIRARRPDLRPKPTVRRLPPRQRNPSRELPALPALLYAAVISDNEHRSDDEAQDADHEEDEQEQIEEIRADSEDDADSQANFQYENPASLEADPLEKMMCAASELTEPCGRQNRFDPLPQGVRRVSRSATGDHDVIISLQVGDKTFETLPEVLCGTEDEPISGRFASCLREYLSDVMFLNTAYDESHSPLPPPSALFSPNAWIESYLDMDEDAPTQVEDPWTESDIGTPERNPHIARAWTVRRRPSLISTYAALNGERGKQPPPPSLPLAQQQQIAQVAPPKTPVREAEPRQALLLEIFLDRPPPVYEMLLETLKEGRLPEAICDDGIFAGTDLQIRLLAALREEAVFLGYRNIVAMVGDEIQTL